jgi:predicted RNase H-like nuclease (RuvC/YqgF family)
MTNKNSKRKRTKENSDLSDRRNANMNQNNMQEYLVNRIAELDRLIEKCTTDRAALRAELNQLISEKNDSGSQLLKG